MGFLCVVVFGAEYHMEQSTTYALAGSTATISHPSRLDTPFGCVPL